ncbi:hypothetical protein ACU686_29490 [Yinghuangia aomiensis]
MCHETTSATSAAWTAAALTRSHDNAPAAYAHGPLLAIIAPPPPVRPVRRHRARHREPCAERA